jgi:hypothetical protein
MDARENSTILLCNSTDTWILVEKDVDGTLLSTKQPVALLELLWNVCFVPASEIQNTEGD